MAQEGDRQQCPSADDYLPWYIRYRVIDEPIKEPPRVSPASRAWHPDAKRAKSLDNVALLLR